MKLKFCEPFSDDHVSVRQDGERVVVRLFDHLISFVPGASLETALVGTGGDLMNGGLDESVIRVVSGLIDQRLIDEVATKCPATPFGLYMSPRVAIQSLVTTGVFDLADLDKYTTTNMHNGPMLCFRPGATMHAAGLRYVFVAPFYVGISCQRVSPGLH